MFSVRKRQELTFFDYFERHARQTAEAAALFRAVCNGGHEILAGMERIKALEHETDATTHECIDLLRRSFITPFDRNDIHRLITKLDDIIDFVEAAADRIALYELQPSASAAPVLGDILVRATAEVDLAVRGLRDLKKPEAILASCRAIGRLEHEADQVLRDAIATLLREHHGDPIAVFKWKEIYETLEDATDRCQDVANVIEGVVLEHA